MVKKAITWSVSASVGGKYPGVDPVFFKERQMVALVTTLAIKMYQLHTRQMIAKIPLDCSDVTQLFLSSDETKFYLVRSSGAVDYVAVDGNNVRRLASIDKVVKVHQLVSDYGDQLIFIGEKTGIEGFILFSLKNDGSEDLQESQELEELYHAEKSDLTAVSHSRKFVAFAGRKEGSNIITYNILKAEGSVKGIRTRRSHILAVSNAGLVAIGSPSGVIDIYYSQGVRALKWHLEEVGALQFTLNDEYLLSGGKERVLVLWQLGTEKQQFLPRLDGPITSIACNSTSTLYGITLGDQQLVVLSAVDLISRLHVSGVKVRYEKGQLDLEKRKTKKKHTKNTSNSISEDCTTPLTIHPGTRHAYMFSGGSQVQIFNPVKDEQEAVLALAASLQTGKVRREHQVIDPKATHLKFTNDGSWMITCDVLPSPGVDPLMSKDDVETQLKFWRRQDDGWTLVTRILQPHGNEKQIVAICPSNSGHELLTAANDGGVRLWKLDNKSGQWTLRKILQGFATTTKAVSVSWSADGSVIALSFGLLVFLIDAKRFTIKSQLPNLVDSRIRSINFVGQHLVIMAKTRLVVYDVVASSLVWSIKASNPLHGDRLISVDKLHSRFAMALNFWQQNNRPASRLVLFDITSPIPLELTIHPFAVSALALIPGTSGYMVLDNRGVLSSLAGTTTAGQTIETSFRSSLTSLYKSAQLMPLARPDDDQRIEDAVTQQLDLNSFNNIFDDESSNIEAVFEKVMTLVSPPVNN